VSDQPLPLRPDGSNSIRVVPYQEGVAFIVQDRATLAGVMIPVGLDAAERLANKVLELVGRARKRAGGGMD
jgi:hypothetical protein